MLLISTAVYPLYWCGIENSINCPRLPFKSVLKLGLNSRYSGWFKFWVFVLSQCESLELKIPEDKFHLQQHQLMMGIFSNDFLPWASSLQWKWLQDLAAVKITDVCNKFHNYFDACSSDVFSPAWQAGTVMKKSSENLSSQLTLGISIQLSCGILSDWNSVYHDGIFEGIPCVQSATFG